MKKLILYLFLALSAQLPAQVQMFFKSDPLSGLADPRDFDSLFYWFAADIGVLDSVGSPIANDDGVGTWPDLSGNGWNTTQTTTANRPTWKLNGGPNNRPSVSFDGTNDFLASAAHLWESDDLTIFMVMKFANATRNAAEIVISKGDQADNTKQFHVFGHNTASSYVIRFTAYRDGGIVNNKNFTASAKSSTYKILTPQSDGATDGGALYWENGGSIATTKTTGGSSGDWTIFDSATPPFMIGAQHSDDPGAFLQGSISEIIVYSRALTTGERQSIEAYLNQKYKLY